MTLTEQNEISLLQVTECKAKGWTVYHNSGTGWVVYEGCSDVLKGDANDDGKVDIVDVTTIIDIILGK